MGSEGIGLRVLGDFGPFSRAGKSIGYMVSVCGENFLLDCGSPLFNQIGGHGLKDITSLIITHCHDDHKRWFTDLALFHRYAPDFNRRVRLLTSEEVLNELRESTGSAMDRSLSRDSKCVIDIAFEEYVDATVLGPRALYRIATVDLGDGMRELRVVDASGRPVPPERAKIVISAKSGRPRLLMLDPDYGEWVEPESFYGYSSERYYTRDRFVYNGPGFRIEAVKSPVWHGIPGVGLKFTTEEDSLLFTSDTVHDLELWEALASEKRKQNLGMPASEFMRASVIHGDINDYIERIWSRERFDEAVAAFDGSAVVQDVSLKNSIVHTDYVRLDHTRLDREHSILTHCPDRITSEWVLCYSDKVYRIRGSRFFEDVQGRLYPFNADIYHKEKGRYFVGYRNDKGKFKVYRNGKVLNLGLNGFSKIPDTGELDFSVDLYEDVSGRYFPYVPDKDSAYVERDDGRVELVHYDDKGSRGEVVESLRETLGRKRG